MPNHVHLIATPKTTDGLRLAIGKAHRRYARHVNLREGWRGYLWQGRFASFHWMAATWLRAARYVELNPVRARLVARAEDWPWSSARAHLEARGDGLVAVTPLLGMIGDWRAFLSVPPADEDLEQLRRHQRTGRPLGGGASSPAWNGPSGAPYAAASRARGPRVRAGR